jgi:GntR family transcriptional regulator of gluconate operon
MVSELAPETLQPEALWQHVVQVMRRAIVLGELEPGVHLKEPLLAQRFGVSRLPIRQAIAQLAREGLVHVAPRRGAYVIGVSDKDVADIYECRQMLECWAVRRTALRIDEQGLAGLLALIEQMDAAVAADQAQDVAAYDMAFHRKLIGLAGNRTVTISWEPLTPLIETILSIAVTAVPDLPTAVGGHREIVRALRRHDPDLACMLLREHLSGGQGLVEGAIRRHRATAPPAQPRRADRQASIRSRSQRASAAHSEGGGSSL